MSDLPMGELKRVRDFIPKYHPDAMEDPSLVEVAPTEAAPSVEEAAEKLDEDAIDAAADLAAALATGPTEDAKDDAAADE
jgi:hypothetical protein